MIAIPLSKLYGGIGCAIANTIGLTIGQIIVMNIYYYKKVHINIVTFWREIGKMSFIPSFFFVIGFFVMPKMHINTFSELFFILILFALVYIPLFVHYGFNREEQNLISVPLKKVFNKIKNNSF